MADSGIVYVLTNTYMPGLVKIGCTAGKVEDRLKQLSGDSGVPVAFKCHFAAAVDDMASKEKTLHQLFSEERVNPNREFFEVAPEKVVLAIRMGSFTEVTPGKPDLPPEEEEAFEKADNADQAKKSNLKLNAIGIDPGAVLTFTRDESVHVTVVTGNKVEYDNQVLSNSRAALLALEKLGKKWVCRSGISLLDVSRKNPGRNS